MRNRFTHTGNTSTMSPALQQHIFNEEWLRRRREAIEDNTPNTMENHLAMHREFTHDTQLST